MRTRRACRALLQAAALTSAALFGQHVLAVAQPVSSSAVSNEDTAPRAAAEQGLITLVQRLAALPPSGNAPRIMAVNHYTDLRRASIGYGFQVNLLDPQALLSGGSLAASAHPSGEWRFVVMLDSQPVGLITVAQVRSRWRMVSAGASELARDIMPVVSRYAGRTPPVQLRFLRSQQAVADFIEVAPSAADTPAAPSYLALDTVREALRQTSGDTRTAAPNLQPRPESQLMPALRASVRRGMLSPRFMHQETPQ
ncbi:hypothetical protein [Burkholderia alba]|uniref:hypothetical protein n=1 Tax=Burkholderia alba TaxID=2683677 RepID=UPI002B05BBB8|nr:hypothetical protein [Burkholderia alba]